MANWTYAQIEEIASEGVSQGELAAQIGLKYYEVVALIRDDEEFRRAFQRGQNINSEIPLARKFAPEAKDFQKEITDEIADETDEIREDLPFTPLSYRGLSNREKVLKAVAEGNHLSRQICAASGLSGGEVVFEIQRVINEQEEREIEEILLVMRVEPTFRAYFLPTGAPDDRDKLILQADGVKIIKFKEPEISAEIWEQKRREADERNKNPTPYIPPVSAMDFTELNPNDYLCLKRIENEENLIKKEITMNTTQPTIKQKMYDADLEGLAAQGLTQKQAAEKIDINYASMQAYFSKEDALKRAWQRGVEKFKANAAKPATAEPAKTDYSKIPVTTEEDEAFKAIESAQDQTLASKVFETIVEPELNKLPDESDNAFQNQIDDMFEQLQQKDEVQVDPRFESVIDKISKNGHSANSIKLKQAEFLDSLPKLPRVEIETFPPEFYAEPEPEHKPEPHSKTVQLSSGGKILVSSDVNFFEASYSERKFMNALADLVQEYEEKR